jgi:hypothetical protein
MARVLLATWRLQHTIPLMLTAGCGWVLDGALLQARPDPSIGLWPLDTIAYCTEGIAGVAAHFPSTSAWMVQQFKPTVDYLLNNQGCEGFWGKLPSSDLERVSCASYCVSAPSCFFDNGRSSCVE